MVGAQTHHGAYTWARVSINTSGIRFAANTENGFLRMIGEMGKILLRIISNTNNLFTID